MTNRYIVIAESIVGSHRIDGGTHADISMYAMTFLTRVEKENDRFIVRAELKENKTFQSILDEYLRFVGQGISTQILVSFDLDENGEIMAEAVKDALHQAGVDPFDVFRVPLTENGYVAIKEFSDTTQYKEFLWHQQRFMHRLVSKSIPRVGFFKIFALASLVKHRGKLFDIVRRPDIINPEGTSTVTFVHNYINAPEDEANKLDKYRFA